jgi:outer membrane receptor protein involved in Fe transport
MKFKLEQRFRRTIYLCLCLCFIALPAIAGTIKGQIIDKETGETLIGATVQVIGTSHAAITDIDGNYFISNLPKSALQLEVRYIGYKTTACVVGGFGSQESIVVDFALQPDNEQLDEVVVVARKNLENQATLLRERKAATIAVENIGAKEMSIKGASTVADGVKKITGVSLAESNQLVVRGLGDRYSTTTLNGLPIASPNPDHKLIPLDLFPSEIVKNITVSKVFQVGAFADYSGAHIDIGTKEHTGADFITFSLHVGSRTNVLFKDFYQSDRASSMFSTPQLDKGLKDLSRNEFESHIKEQDLFGTDFSISNRTAIPDFGASFGMGKNWEVAGNTLSLLTSLGVDKSAEIIEDAYITTLTADGSKLNNFEYDSYTSELKMAGLLNLGYAFRKTDRINYSLFYARNATDNYMSRDGYDSEGIELKGSNSVFHAYALLNNQLAGKHALTDKWQLDWSTSYGVTTSDEPDRRQVMFRKDGDDLSLFKLNQQETMRYFGDLDESEFVADIRSVYNFGTSNLVRAGATYKDKQRDFTSTRFYYDMKQVNPEIASIYDTNGYLNQANIANGTINITRDDQPKNSYYANNNVVAAFAEIECYPIKALLINLGVRYEQSIQTVDYWNDASIAKQSTRSEGDLFPALNLKYTLDDKNTLRLSLSKTVTRPSFIEMAPFLYKEAYGKAEVRGNENLLNGYNYNADLRYELYPATAGDLLAITGYFKYLDSPIERVQQSSGGSAVHSFRNSDEGVAAGIEVEVRKAILKDLHMGANVSYMHTNVKLPKGGGIYTEDERSLQGASPYLANADISYAPRWDDDRSMILSLMYNLQGPRIHTVGIYGLGDVEQQTLHTVDFVGSYAFNSQLSIKLAAKNLLNQSIRYVQNVKSNDTKQEVEAFKTGISTQLGITYRF